jgi:hypothetical protein
MKRKPILGAAVIAGLLLALMLAGCGRSPSTSASPTQTPIYVVVTDTPAPGATQTAAAGQQTEEPEQTPEGEGGAEGEEAGPEDTGVVPIPTPFVCKAEIVEQTFEQGFMFWVGGTVDERCQVEHDFEPGSGEIWVLILDDDNAQYGKWYAFTDDWDEDTDPESDPDMEPEDEDLIQPVRGFGKVWRDDLTDDQRDQLGYATAGEFKFVTDYRYDPGGFLNEAGEFVPRPGIHRLVALGGEQLFFDEQSGEGHFINPADDEDEGDDGG